MIETPRLYLHDIARFVLRGSTVGLALLAAIVVLSVTLSVQPASLGNTGVGFAGVYYYSAGEYHFLLHVDDGSGEPIRNAVLETSIADNRTSPVIWYNYSASSDSAGLARLSAPLPLGVYQVIYSLRTPAPALVTGVLLPNGSGQPIAAFGVISSFTSGNFPASAKLAVFFSGLNGTNPAGDQVSIAPASIGLSGDTKDRVIGTLGSYFSTFEVRVDPTVPLWNVSIRSPSGTVEASLIMPSREIGPQPPSATPDSASLFGGLGALELLVPWCGVWSVYLAFGRPMANGHLDSVVARPVTRSDLLTSRWMGSTGVTTCAALAGVFGIQLALLSGVGHGLSSESAAWLVMGLVLESGAVCGVSLLATVVVSRRGAAIAVSFAVTAIWTILWPLSTDLLTAAAGPASGGSDRLSLALANPVQLPNLLVAGSSGLYWNGSLFTLGSPLDPVDVAAPLLLLVGVAWFLIPGVVARRLWSDSARRH